MHTVFPVNELEVSQKHPASREGDASCMVVCNPVLTVGEKSWNRTATTDILVA